MYFTIGIVAFAGVNHKERQLQTWQNASQKIGNLKYCKQNIDDNFMG